MHPITLSTTALRVSKTVLFFAMLGFLFFSFSPDCHAKVKEKHIKKIKQPAKPEFGLKDVVEMAKKLAAADYEDPRGKMPKWLLDITYDQLRDIRFIPDKSYWRQRKPAL